LKYLLPTVDKETDPSILLNIGEMLGKARKTKENLLAQLKCYYSALHHGDDNLDLRYKLAKLNLEIGNNQQAAVEYERILKMDENSKIAMEELYKLYILFNDVQKLGPISFKLGKELKENLGSQSFSMDEESPVHLCIKYYTNAYMAMPNNIEILIALADLYRMIDRHKEALHFIKEALKVNNKDYYIYYIGCMIYDDIGDTLNAKELIKTYNTYGNLLRKEKSYIEAAKAFETGLIFEEDNILLLNNYGNCLLEMGNKNKAKDMYLKAYHLDNNLIEINSNLATIYRKECISVLI
jgi:tetratricopeptide (TPR) repeat protein